MELNCENLFDTVHDSLKNDMEFLPNGDYHWSRMRYWRKINHLSQEIIALGELNANEHHLPDLVALCEVENDSAMIALTRRGLLRKAGYEYVMTSSPDERGIDVALMYQPFSFRLLHHHSIRIKPLPKMRPTRDILYAKGVLLNDDTLHVFVLHAPSRRGGEQASRPYRLEVASQLLQSVDSIRQLCDSARILVAGDFNDYDDSPALRKLESSHLINISKGAKGQNGAKGTYRYQGEWRSLDHVFCSPGLAASMRRCEIGDLPFLLMEDEKYGGKKPFRTYLGPRYLGGYSDHLPLVTWFQIE